MEIKIENFKNSVINAVNTSELPLSLISYVLKDILNEVEGVRAQDLQKERQEQQASYEEIPVMDTEVDLDTI